MSNSLSFSIIIVERLGSLKQTTIQDFKIDDLYKKCGFKKPDNFKKHAEWKVSYEKNRYLIQLYAKSDGRANSENKYEFPPPVDTTLFYGNCALVARLEKKEHGVFEHTNLSLAMWNTIYQQLYGGFDTLVTTAKEDEDEEDELIRVPKQMKTKSGYLKDGFIVDSSDSDEMSYHSEEEEVIEHNDEPETEEETSSEYLAESTGSELSEESYEEDEST